MYLIYIYIYIYIYMCVCVCVCVCVCMYSTHCIHYITMSFYQYSINNFIKYLFFIKRYNYIIFIFNIFI